jgi:hypothetical protein
MSDLFNKLREETTNEGIPYTLRDGEYKGYKLFRFSNSSSEGVPSHSYIAIKGMPDNYTYADIRNVADKEHPDNPLITTLYQTTDNALSNIKGMIDDKNKSDD